MKGIKIITAIILVALLGLGWRQFFKTQAMRKAEFTDAVMTALKKSEQGLFQESIMAFEKALAAAKEGVEYTKTIIATKGRASYLGERSLGHIDPGSMSSCLLLNVIYDML